MASKDELKSARKKFMVMRVKTSIMQILQIDNADVDAKLTELLKPLQETFGKQEGLEILENAIVAADEQFSNAMMSGISTTVAKAVEGI